MEDTVEQAEFEEVVNALPEKLRPFVLATREVLPGAFWVEYGNMTMILPGEPEEECEGFAFSQSGENVAKYNCATRVIVALKGDDDLIMQVAFENDSSHTFMKSLASSSPDSVAALVRSAMVPRHLAS